MAVVEGDTDIPIVRALARDVGMELVGEPLDMGGKAQLDERLNGFNQAAMGGPWFVVRDLDNDAECAPAFLRATGFSPSNWIVFTLAVREVEAWLLADAQGLASFLRVSQTRIPANPDAELDPTVALVNLARGSSSRSIRDGMVPKPGGGTQVGPLYESLIIEFGSTAWDLNRACLRSPSLARTRAALQSLASRWSEYVAGGAPGKPARRKARRRR